MEKQSGSDQTPFFPPTLLLKSLESIGLERRTALIEVISNIGSYHGARILCNYLKDCKSPEMAIACAHVLGELRDPLAMPIFLDALHSPHLNSEAFLIKVIDSVSLIADPEAIAPLRILLKHPLPPIRARAIKALVALGDEGSLQEIENLRRHDSDIEVRRALQKIERKAV